MKYSIKTIKTYPDDGNHKEVVIDLPFYISRGLDSFTYIGSTGKEKEYNSCKSSKTDRRWIVLLKEGANPSLKKIFNIRLDKDLDKILDYCMKIYKKSLIEEISRLERELKGFEEERLEII